MRWALCLGVLGALFTSWAACIGPDQNLAGWKCTTASDCGNARLWDCSTGVCRGKCEFAHNCYPGEACIKGICIPSSADGSPQEGAPEPEVRCPTTCTSTAECSPCPGNDIACIAGVCKPGSSCPSRCSRNADCQQCGSDAYCDIIISRTCKSSPCGPCTADADCALSPSCIASTKLKCVDGRCTAAACPSSCSSDAGCGLCGPDYRCENQRCTQATPANLNCNTNGQKCPIRGGKQLQCESSIAAVGFKQCTLACSVDGDCPSYGEGTQLRCVTGQSGARRCLLSCTHGGKKDQSKCQPHGLYCCDRSALGLPDAPYLCVFAPCP